MSHYVMVDGQLIRSTWEAKNWIRRAAKAVAKWDPNWDESPQVDLTDRRSEFEIIQDLEETE